MEHYFYYQNLNSFLYRYKSCVLFMIINVYGQILFVVAQSYSQNEQKTYILQVYSDTDIYVTDSYIHKSLKKICINIVSI